MHGSFVHIRSVFSQSLILQSIASCGESEGEFLPFFSSRGVRYACFYHQRQRKMYWENSWWTARKNNAQEQDRESLAYFLCSNKQAGHFCLYMTNNQCSKNYLGIPLYFISDEFFSDETISQAK
jgi:hypothetical protein